MSEIKRKRGRPLIEQTSDVIKVIERIKNANLNGIGPKVIADKTGIGPYRIRLASGSGTLYYKSTKRRPNFTKQEIVLINEALTSISELL